MRRIPDSAYIRGFLIDALVSALPLKEATSIVDSLLPCIYSELECDGRVFDDYAIKAAFARVLKKKME